ncbi:hypothetical protein GQX73_g8542 [Xylaria multiplex]|uniref:Uncharacterized protein n=1 Tax=Xylaria multiplex TaxID=323545 RepID=A0A7C8MPX7_9PEZI|nr:hypothetical protein GQX73_g8542 [Xylaria multiplex]
MADLNNGSLQLVRTGLNPTVEDVFEARRILTQLGTNNHTVPMEIALMILSLASYHPYQSSIKQLEAIYKANDFWKPGPQASVAGLYLTMATLPISDTIARAKSITFQMEAADQGWATFGGEGTYRNSHTWYEVSILRPQSTASTAASLANTDIENFPTPQEARVQLRNHGWDMVENDGTVTWKVHKNITASSEYRHYRVDWVAGIPTEVDDPGAMGDGQGFLALLRPGDVVALWARAEVCLAKHRSVLWVEQLTFISNKLGLTRFGKRL